ncbi:hypothetical protein [Sphingomonas glaciei]|uniref:Secreted protein n=1 Tax=Sphingomonas glaciei TaxID=2938948 RepID=A0ABY5MVU8_9SPHN|nr:hypothetical protein [Sphingomonas glaciei]UUR07457.1 hypothetical protein M1K48_10980 [Sphingomonas glaciei]
MIMGEGLVSRLALGQQLCRTTRCANLGHRRGHDRPRIRETAMMVLATALLVGASQVSATPASPVVPATAENPGARIKCRKQQVTGSLARFTKECRTVDEWARLDDANRESATKIQDRGLVVGCGSNPTGC